MKRVWSGGHTASSDRIFKPGLTGAKTWRGGGESPLRSRQRQQQVERPPDFYDVVSLGNNLGTEWLRTMNKRGIVGGEARRGQTVGGEARGKGQAVEGFEGQERTSALSL